jgi:hypothetical protein
LQTIFDFFIYHPTSFIGLLIAALYFLRLGWLYFFDRKQFQKETAEGQSNQSVPWEAVERERIEYIIELNPKETRK